MVRFISKSAYLIFSLLIFTSLNIQAQSLTNSYVPGEVIIKYKDTSSSSSGLSKKDNFKNKHNKVAAKKNLSSKNQWVDIGTYHYKIPQNKKVTEIISELKNDPDIEFVEPNYYVAATTAVKESERLSGQSLDDYVEQVFGDVGAMAGSYNQTSAPIDMTAAWDELPGGGTEVVVAVIDTGIDISHDLLEHAIWTNPGEIAGNGIDDDSNGYIDDVHGWDFVQDDNSPNLPDYKNGIVSAANSCNDHGTHVAGIIRGATQDIIPTGGYTTLPLAQTYVRIMPVKFLDCDGVGTTSDAISGIYYAVNNGAKILNNSWGGGSFSSSLHSAIVYSYNHDRLFVAAAGNSSNNIDTYPMYPASYPVPNVLSVGATTSFDYKAGFSNYGTSSVHIGSPGVGIISTVPDDLNSDGTDDTMSMSGTSMAAPLVSGIAAMMAYKQPTMIGYQLKNIILNAIDVPFIDTNASGTLDGGETVKLSGYFLNSGRVNAQESIIDAKAAAIDNSSPSYDASSYNASRAPATATEAAAGCGLVKRVYDRHNDDTKKQPINTLSIILTILIFALPIVLTFTLRNSQKYQRKFERYYLGSQVQISIGSKEYLGSVGTISLGGLSFNSKGTFKLGHTLNLSVSGPEGKENVNVEGQIVWVTNDNKYGVKFNNTQESVLVKINEWAKGLKKA